MGTVYAEKCRIWYMYGIFETYGIGGMLFVLVVMKILVGTHTCAVKSTWVCALKLRYLNAVPQLTSEWLQPSPSSTFFHLT